ncbi:MAG: hisS [Chloroflexi bacterium]|nr:hisS [Chloroflexota bacterium]
MAAVERAGALHQQNVGMDVLLVPIGPDDYADAAALASKLRGQGIRVELDVRLRGPKADLRHADREGVPIVLIVGERERDEGVVNLRDMAARDEVRVPRLEVIEAVRVRLDARSMA